MKRLFERGLFLFIACFTFIFCNVAFAENATVSIQDATDIKIDSATINASVTASSSVCYWFEYGLNYNTLFNNTMKSDGSCDTIAKGGKISAKISGLSANTLYYYRACAKSGLSTFCSGTSNFRTFYTPTIGPASIVTINADSIVVSGNIVDLGGNNLTNSYRVDVSQSYNFETKKSSQTLTAKIPGTYEVEVKGLTADTQYYARFCDKNSYSNDVCSQTISFSTKKAEQVSIKNNPPVFNNVRHEFIEQTKVKLSAELMDLGSASSYNYYFEYAVGNINFTSPAVNGSTKVTKINTPFSVEISGLLFNTTYYYRACLVNVNNTEDVVCSNPNFFNVEDILNKPLGISDVKITDVKEKEARISGNITGFASNASLRAYVDYTAQNSGIRNTSMQTIISNTSRQFSFVIDNLSPNETYKYSVCIVGSGAYYCTNEANLRTAILPVIGNKSFVQKSSTEAVIYTELADTGVGDDNTNVWVVYSTDSTLKKYTSTEKKIYSGSFVENNLKNLTKGGTYYCKICASNTLGEVCGDTFSFTLKDMQNTQTTTGNKNTEVNFSGDYIRLLDFTKTSETSAKISARLLSLGNLNSINVYATYRKQDDKNYIKTSSINIAESNKDFSLILDKISKNNVYQYKVCVSINDVDYCTSEYKFSLFDGREYGTFYKVTGEIANAKFDAVVAERFAGKVVALNGDYSNLWYISAVNLNRYFFGDYKNGFKVARTIARKLTKEEFSKLDFESKKANINYAGEFIYNEEDEDTIYYIDTNSYRMWYFVDKTAMATYIGNQVEYISSADLLKINYKEMGDINYDLENTNDLDSDGLFDDIEINIYKTNPYNPDTDGDGYLDYTEILNGYSAKIKAK